MLGVGVRRIVSPVNSNTRLPRGLFLPSSPSADCDAGFARRRAAVRSSPRESSPSPPSPSPAAPSPPSLRANRVSSMASSDGPDADRERELQGLWANAYDGWIDVPGESGGATCTPPVDAPGGVRTHVPFPPIVTSSRLFALTGFNPMGEERPTAENRSREWKTESRHRGDDPGAQGVVARVRVRARLARGRFRARVRTRGRGRGGKGGGGPRGKVRAGAPSTRIRQLITTRGYCAGARCPRRWGNGRGGRGGGAVRQAGAQVRRSRAAGRGVLASERVECELDSFCFVCLFAILPVIPRVGLIPSLVAVRLRRRRILGEVGDLVGASAAAACCWAVLRRRGRVGEGVTPAR